MRNTNPKLEYMRHCITSHEAEQLTEKQAYNLFGYVPKEYWDRHLHIGSLIQFIRGYCQMNIFTVDDTWCVQLFDLDVSANDLVSCIYENSNDDLVSVLFESLLWAMENKED